MPQYELVVVAKPEDGQLIGYAVRKSGTLKLEGSNIYRLDERNEAEEYINILNEGSDIRQFMPVYADPDVQALLNDPTFSPVEYEEVEVPDLERSNLVYMTKPGPRIGTEQDGVTPIFGPDEVKYDDVGKPAINWIASEIVTKKEMQPINTSNKSRIDLAREQVARARREEALGGNQFG